MPPAPPDEASMDLDEERGYKQIKAALSLYKVQQSIYLLDFQRVEGDTFGFMKLCSLIITELKNLSAQSRAQAQQQQAQQQQQQMQLQQQMGMNR